MMNRTQMSFFPEDVQKEIYARVERQFQPEQPYSTKIVEKVKDKFAELERYKLETVGGILRQANADKKKGSVMMIDR